MVYDSLGRVQELHYEDCSIVRYHYDLHGNRTSVDRTPGNGTGSSCPPPLAHNPPTAQDDPPSGQALIANGCGLDITPLDNNSDPDGDPLSILITDPASLAPVSA